MNELDISFNNEFEIQLKKEGYKWFKDNWKKSIRGFQKKFSDQKGTKYFITGYHYNHSKQLNRPDLKLEDSYMFDVQFILDDVRFEEKERINGKSQCIDIQFSADFLPNEYRPITSLYEVEQFYEKIWNNLGQPYYELKNDYGNGTNKTI